MPGQRTVDGVQSARLKKGQRLTPCSNDDRRHVFTFCSILEVFVYVIYFDPSQEFCNIGGACIFTKPIF